MRLTLTATLAIAYGNLPTQATRNKKKSSAPLTTQLEAHPYRLDLKEDQLSADILAMQHRIREGKRQDHDVPAAPGIEKKPNARVSALQSTCKHAGTADAGVRMSRKDHWEKLKLADVRSCDLEAMDLTSLPPSLLAHPKGASVDYTRQEHEMAMALLEKKVLRWMASVSTDPMDPMQ